MHDGCLASPVMLELLVDRVKFLASSDEVVDVRRLCHAEVDCERLDGPVGANCELFVNTATACADMATTLRLRTRVHPALCIPLMTDRVACTRGHHPQVARHRLVPAVCLRLKLDHVDVVCVYRDRLAVCSTWYHRRRSRNDLSTVSDCYIPIISNN
jgi:hypothetical protein